VTQDDVFRAGIEAFSAIPEAVLVRVIDAGGKMGEPHRALTLIPDAKGGPMSLLTRLGTLKAGQTVCVERIAAESKLNVQITSVIERTQYFERFAFTHVRPKSSR
jgi:hypothetical protein